MLLRRRHRRPRVALAGAGAIATVHALAARTAGLQVAAVASAGGVSARHLAGQLDARRCSTDDIATEGDVLIVATPPDHHLAPALAGLEAGAAVLVEKPLAPNLAQADRLVEAAAADGAVLRCAENLLHAPVVVEALRRRRDLGALGHLSLRTVQPPPDWGHFRSPLSAGGVLFDLGPHPLAVAVALAAEQPCGVRAELRSSRSDGADDHAEVQLRFPSGLVADLEVSWTGAEPHWTAQAAGADGVVRVDLLPEVVLEVDGSPVGVADRFQAPDPALERFGYVDQLLDLWATVQGEVGRAGQTAAEARDVLEVICAAYTSAGAGGDEVPLPFTGDRALVPLAHWRR